MNFPHILPGKEAKPIDNPNYQGLPITIKRHADGSVTVCADIARAIAGNKDVPAEIREYFQ